jgi:hypothetical protein
VDEVAGADGGLVAIELEEEFTGEDIEEFFEVMGVQRRPVMRGADVFKDGDGVGGGAGSEFDEGFFADETDRLTAQAEA